MVLSRLFARVEQTTRRRVRVQLAQFLAEDEVVLDFELGDIVVDADRPDLFDESQPVRIALTDRALYLTTAGGLTTRIAYRDVGAVSADGPTTNIRLAGGELVELHTLGTKLGPALVQLAG